jgi:hypothetical protein
MIVFMIFLVSFLGIGFQLLTFILRLHAAIETISGW